MSQPPRTSNRQMARACVIVAIVLFGSGSTACEGLVGISDRALAVNDATPDSLIDTRSDEVSEASSDVPDAAGSDVIDAIGDGRADAPDLSRPPSCRSGGVGTGSDCGSDGKQDCCAIGDVSGGDFLRANDASAPAHVSAFRLDVYEITLGRYLAFLDAGYGVRGTPPAPGDGVNEHRPGTGWQVGWNSLLEKSRADVETGLASCGYSTWGGDGHMPVNCVTWYEAFAFCAWDSGRLATEAEWNFAAAGGDDQRVFPWSSPPSATSADTTRAQYCSSATDKHNECIDYSLTSIAPVGTHPAGIGRFGQQDLSGNLWEWVLDYKAAVLPVPCNDCVVMSDPALLREIRGGSWAYGPPLMRTTYRDGSDASFRGYNFGIRCARPKP